METIIKTTMQTIMIITMRLNCSYFWFPPSYWHLWEEGVPKSRAFAQDTGKDLASLL
jgi:hypothetical protein